MEECRFDYKHPYCLTHFTFEPVGGGYNIGADPGLCKNAAQALQHEMERLLRDPTTAEIARLRSVVNERDVEQARLQRELNVRVEMLVAAIEERDALQRRIEELEGKTK